jgi:hypothetical protein
MPAMTAYLDDYDDVICPGYYINGFLIDEAEALARGCLRDALKDLYTPWVHCAVTEPQCGECRERSRKRRAIMSAINAGHGRWEVK